MKRWIRTWSKSGTRDLIDLNVAWEAEAIFKESKRYAISDWKPKKKVLHTMILYDLKVGREMERIKVDVMKRRGSVTRTISSIICPCPHVTQHGPGRFTCARITYNYSLSYMYSAVTWMEVEKGTDSDEDNYK